MLTNAFRRGGAQDQARSFQCCRDVGNGFGSRFAHGTTKQRRTIAGFYLVKLL
jgi:hypothetical protein